MKRLKRKQKKFEGRNKQLDITTTQPGIEGVDLNFRRNNTSKGEYSM